MGSAIGELVVGLGVDNQQFISALNESGSKLDEFAVHGRKGGAADGALLAADKTAENTALMARLLQEIAGKPGFNLPGI